MSGWRARSFAAKRVVSRPARGHLQRRRRVSLYCYEKHSLQRWILELNSKDEISPELFCKPSVRQQSNGAIDMTTIRKLAFGANALVFATTGASAGIACSEGGDRWRAKTDYDYRPELGFTISPDVWRWNEDEDLRS
jgi:hypothetical protein